MAKHKPSTIWPTSPIGKYPQIYVQTKDAKNLEISFFPIKGQDGGSVTISRHAARMLAKRLTQCLEDTK